MGGGGSPESLGLQRARADDFVVGNRATLKLLSIRNARPPPAFLNVSLKRRAARAFMRMTPYRRNKKARGKKERPTPKKNTQYQIRKNLGAPYN